MSPTQVTKNYYDDAFVKKAEADRAINKTHESALASLQPGSRVYYNDLYENSGNTLHSRMSQVQSASQENLASNQAT